MGLQPGGRRAIKSQIISAVFISLIIVLTVFTGCGKTPVETTSSPTRTSSTQTSTTHATTASVSTGAPQPTTTTFTSSAAAKEIFGKASKAASGLQTYLYDRNLTVLKSTKPDKSDLATTTVISKNVALDLKARRMQMDNKILFKQSSGNIAWPLIENSIFVDNETMYIQGLFPNDTLAWTKIALTESIWQQQNLITQLIDTINPDNITVLAPEIVRLNDLDTPCDVLRINPNLKKLWDFLVMQPGTGMPSTLPEGSTYEQIVKSCEMSFWVSQSSGIPVQSLIKLNIASPTSTMIMDLNLKLVFSDFNKPVSIKVTSEALAAKELNLQKP